MRMDELLRRIYYLKSYKGYPCLVSCIKKVKEDESRLCGIRKKVYIPVAREHGVKLENMEKKFEDHERYVPKPRRNGAPGKAARRKTGIPVSEGAD